MRVIVLPILVALPGYLSLQGKLDFGGLMMVEVARWDKILSMGQQQRLSFARILLHRPKWVFLDEATSALDDANQELVMSIFASELTETSLMSIAHRPGLERYHHRTLHLIYNRSGSVMISKAWGIFTGDE